MTVPRLLRHEMAEIWERHIKKSESDMVLARGLVVKTRRRGHRLKSARKVSFWKSSQEFFCWADLPIDISTRGLKSDFWLKWPEPQSPFLRFSRPQNLSARYRYLKVVLVTVGSPSRGIGRHGWRLTSRRHGRGLGGCQVLERERAGGRDTFWNCEHWDRTSCRNYLSYVLVSNTAPHCTLLQRAGRRYLSVKPHVFL
jgi:hypothetical protein